MHRLIVLFVLIALVLIALVLAVLPRPCPPVDTVIWEWERDAAAYERGEISFDELIRRSDFLIECSRRRWEREQERRERERRER